MLEEIVYKIIEKRLDSQVMNDYTYKLLFQKQEECLQKLKNNPEEYEQLLSNYIEASTACSAWENTLAYRKGMLDCAELLRELFFCK